MLGRAVVAASILIASPAWSASVTSAVTKEGKTVVILTGEIEKSDPGAVTSIIKTANEGGRSVSAIRLNSIGGSLAAGVAIADIIRFGKLATVVPNGAVCASACFLIFAAGAEKFASHSANVGVHGASEDGRETIRAGAATVSMARVARDLGVPAPIIGKMVVTPAEQMVWLTPDELRSMGATMTGKPTQVREDSASNPQAPLSLTSPSVPNQLPQQTNRTDVTWKELVSFAVDRSASQHNGRPNFNRVCQPELKTCSVGIWFKGKDGLDMLVKRVENMRGETTRREVCEFNSYGDVRICTDWDTGEKSRDMKNEKGQWIQVAND